jgi:hypothetical protein
MIRLIVMATLERILYPSNKFAFGAFSVVLVFVAMLSYVRVTDPANLLCFGLGIGIGWFGHVLAMRHYKGNQHSEFRSWEVKLQRAQHQLDSVRSF